MQLSDRHRGAERFLGRANCRPPEGFRIEVADQREKTDAQQGDGPEED